MKLIRTVPFKGLRWGVTKNVIDRLKNQNLPWYVILLFLSHESGYLLSMGDVNYYIKNVWPLGADGDYKLSEGNYLSRNRTSNSLISGIKELKNITPHWCRPKKPGGTVLL
jgi:hypothetical protein